MDKDEGRGTEPEPKLPKASVDKVVSETLTHPITCSREVKHILLSSCAEFVHIIATEANDACEKEQKKTVTHEHVYTALRNLGYASYIEECNEAYKEYQEQTKLRPSKQNKFKESGLTQDELEKEQEELFRKAKLMALNNDQPN
ncbi:down-regulator of transcription 1 [Nematocida homosporus]|uniref:down-regulator of transcription 1 n=1 Tax=Nematocida homosporus TaxID=1912981 RepID=UPI002220432E|nr:down-regulator of transcription 1 [Nematocida homosporus]KAI5185653.1 down-regulator of transcription 1 [Nematocida homosporus]